MATEVCEVITTVNQFGDEVHEPVVPRKKYVKSYVRTFAIGDKVRCYYTPLNKSITGTILYAKEKKIDTYANHYIVSGYVVRDASGQEYHVAESSLFMDRYEDFYEGY